MNFVDITSTITKTGNDMYDFKIFRKVSISQTQVKENSNIASYKKKKKYIN